MEGGGSNGRAGVTAEAAVSGLINGQTQKCVCEARHGFTQITEEPWMVAGLQLAVTTHAP